MRAHRLIAAAAASGALVAVLIVGTGLGWWSSSPTTATAPADPLSVAVSLDPHPAFFGDVLAAEIDVRIDPAVVSRNSVRVTPSFAPYVETGPPTVSRSGTGRRETLTYRYSLQCVSDTCLPSTKPFALTLPALTVSAQVGTRQLKATAAWPTTFVASRLQAKDINTTHFRRSKSMPAPKYTVSPGALANGLTAVAGLLAAAGLGLLGFELVRLIERRRRQALAILTPLETALAYTREAAARPDPADRRKALGLLAKTLEGEGIPALAGAAGDVAWSEEPPSPDRVLGLADEIEDATGATA